MKRPEIVDYHHRWPLTLSTLLATATFEISVTLHSPTNRKASFGNRRVAMTASKYLAAALRRKQTPCETMSLSAVEPPEKTLRLQDLVLFGIGGTLGSGLFLLAGHVARDLAGPGVSISFALAGLACFFSAFSYAEMSSRLPDSGGAYAFSYAGLGELPAFLVGMCLTLEYGVSSAAVARAWASYMGDVFTFLPNWVTGANSQVSFLAFIIIAAISMLLSLGMREAKWVINTATIMYALVVAIIVAFGSGKIDTKNWHPFLPFGFHGVVTASSAVFFAYIGFDEVSCVSEEAINAATNVPLAIIISMLAVTVIYVISSLVLTGMVNYSELDIYAPFSSALRTVGLPFIARLVAIGTSIGLMNTATVGMAAQPRIFLSMGRDGLLPRFFAHSTRRSTIICGVIVALLAAFVRTGDLADVVSGGTLLAFMATNVALLLTRSRIHSPSSRLPIVLCAFILGTFLFGGLAKLVIKRLVPAWILLIVAIPGCLVMCLVISYYDWEGGESVERAPPSFLCPYVPLVPLLGSFTTSFLICQLPKTALIALCTWLLISTLAYFLYGVRKSAIANGYVTVVHPATSRSYNSFDNLAIEAHSISSETPSEEAASSTLQPADPT